MNDPIDTASEQRLQEYLSQLAAVLGHADRKERLVGYCTGLLLPGARKSVEPMAARLDPAHVPSLHQALHHFVTTAAVPPALVRHVAPVAAGSTSASPATTSGPNRRNPPPACSGHSGTSHPSWPLSVRLRSREPDTQSTFVS